MSATGLRILGRAAGRMIQRKQPAPGASGQIETYRNCNRYVVVTGQQLPGSPDHLAPLDELLDSVVERLDASRQAQNHSGFEPADHANGARRPLPPWLQELVKIGVPEGERSDQFHHVVCNCASSAGRLTTSKTSHLASRGHRAKYLGDCFPRSSGAMARLATAICTDEGGADGLITEDSAAQVFAERLAASFASAFIPRRGTAGPHNLASEETNLAFTLPGRQSGSFQQSLRNEPAMRTQRRPLPRVWNATVARIRHSP